MKYRFVSLVVALTFWCTAQAEWHHTTVAGSGGVPLNVVTAGSPTSPAILFIHGIGQSHYSFVHQLNSDLAEHYFLVAFDLRGHGASGKPWLPEAYGPPGVWAGDVAAVMAATGVSKPVVVAWSYGTLVLMDYIREFGLDNLSGINLTGALGALVPFRMATDDPDIKAILELQKLRNSPRLVDNIRANEGMVQWLTAEPIPEGDRALLQAIGLMLPVYARNAMMQRQLNNQDMLAQLSLPVLVSLGEHDNPLQLEDADDLASSRNNFRLSVYPGAGHSVFFERPQQFNEELKEFVAEILKRPSP